MNLNRINLKIFSLVKLHSPSITDRSFFFRQFCSKTSSTIMDNRLIECVPNFSEGVSKKVLEKIAEAIRNTKGVTLLGVDPGASTNRTVYTFVGTPDDVIEGAINAAKVAHLLIDMTTHKGEHPRLGAMDVCPFVPVRNATLDDCVECANRLGKRLGEELNVPVYLYGSAAHETWRTTVPQIRSGMKEYEGIPSAIVKKEWKPDFGPAHFIPRWGATMVGARKFLLAYNVNILGTKEQAHRIALDLREAGRGPGQEGKLKAVQGLGWWLAEGNMAQISYNLTDHDITPLHLVFEESKKIAESMNLSVVGSELVGLAPISSLLAAAEYYIEKENLFILDDDQKVRLAIDRLGLNSLYPFDPKERIVEWKVESMDDTLKPLLDATVTAFVNEVRARKAAPGGGSVAALVGSLGVSLGAMVAQLTYGKRQWEHLDSTMRPIIGPLYKTANDLLPFVEADTVAFDEYVAAVRESKSDTSKEAQAALLNAINVPLNLAKTLDSMWEHMNKLAEVGNPNCVSDIQVGVKCIETGIFGGMVNVKINCESLQDKVLREKLIAEAEDLFRNAEEQTRTILKKLDK